MVPAMWASTSASQAWGSTSLSLAQEADKGQISARRHQLAQAVGGHGTHTVEEEALIVAVDPVDIDLQDTGFLDQSQLVNGTERCPVFGKIRCPIFCTSRDSNLGCYPEAALPSSSFTATLSIPALRLVLSR